MTYWLESNRGERNWKADLRISRDVGLSQYEMRTMDVSL